MDFFLKRRCANKNDDTIHPARSFGRSVMLNCFLVTGFDGRQSFGSLAIVSKKLNTKSDGTGVNMFSLSLGSCWAISGDFTGKCERPIVAHNIRHAIQSVSNRKAHFLGSYPDCRRATCKLNPFNYLMFISSLIPSQLLNITWHCA